MRRNERARSGEASAGRAKRLAARAAAAAALAVIAGCASTKDAGAPVATPAPSAPAASPDPIAPGLEAVVDGVRYRSAAFSDLPGWREDDGMAAALTAFRRSCARFAAGLTRDLGGPAARAGDWAETCAAAETADPGEARAFFEANFTPARTAEADRSLVTSYFEPVLDARRAPGGAFTHPLYARPSEVVIQDGAYGVVRGGVFQPYLTRREIDEGALAGRGLEIAYLNDPVDLFFLQIQGSGRLRFGDGETGRVAFGGKNGRPYTSVARVMIDQGLATASTASAGTIQRYVAANPEAGRRLLHANESYVFFRFRDDLDPAGGPVGAIGVQLTDGRSIAVDPAFNSLGAPVWLETDDSPTGPIRRLTVAQDVGTAIKGPQRADLFWGSGADAGALAGRMRHGGRLTMLLPNAVAARVFAQPGA